MYIYIFIYIYIWVYIYMHACMYLHLKSVIMKCIQSVGDLWDDSIKRAARSNP